jgi:hypothetical protein
MAQPRRVSRSGKDDFGGEPWNALIHLCGEDLAEFSDVQRPAALVYTYWSEVMNGGH